MVYRRDAPALGTSKGGRRGVACYDPHIYFGALAPKTISAMRIQGQTPGKKLGCSRWFSNGSLTNGFGPWFSNSDFGIRVSKLGKDLILYCKHYIKCNERNKESGEPLNVGFSLWGFQGNLCVLCECHFLFVFLLKNLWNKFKTYTNAFA